MKIKVTYPDGKVLEAEGTAEECQCLIQDNAAQVIIVPGASSPDWQFTPPIMYGTDATIVPFPQVQVIK